MFTFESGRMDVSMTFKFALAETFYSILYILKLLTFIGWFLDLNLVQMNFHLHYISLTSNVKQAYKETKEERKEKKRKEGLCDCVARNKSLVLS